VAYDFGRVELVVVDALGFVELVVDAPGGRVVAVVVDVDAGSIQAGRLSGQSRPPTLAMMSCLPGSMQVSVHAARPLNSVPLVASPARIHRPMMSSVTAAPATGERCTTPSSSTVWLRTRTATSTSVPAKGGLGAMLDVTT
jgi:hypothetical protein